MYALSESIIKLHDNSKYSHSCLNHLLILNMKIHVYSPTCSIKRQSSNVKSGPTRGKWLRQVQSLMIVCVSSVYVLETTSCRDKHCKTCHLSMKWKQKCSGWGTGKGIMLCGRAEIIGHITSVKQTSHNCYCSVDCRPENESLVTCAHNSKTSALRELNMLVCQLNEREHSNLWEHRFNL